jgi:hypothetical protein
MYLYYPSGSSPGRLAKGPRLSVVQAASDLLYPPLASETKIIPHTNNKPSDAVLHEIEAPHITATLYDRKQKPMTVLLCQGEQPTCQKIKTPDSIGMDRSRENHMLESLTHMKALLKLHLQTQLSSVPNPMHQ